MKIKVGKGLSMMCKCLNKILCVCIKFLRAPSRNHQIRTYEKDLAEWKRIEGIDQYIQRRN